MKQGRLRKQPTSSLDTTFKPLWNHSYTILKATFHKHTVHSKYDKSPRLWKREVETASHLVIQGQQRRVRDVAQGHLLAEVLEPLQQAWVRHDLVQPAHLLVDCEGVLASSCQARCCCGGGHFMDTGTAGQLDSLQRQINGQEITSQHQ